ncbi:hypothetical protein [Roseococcus sp.]|uniref:hypothetical protein n=1 Tax=Roseococcus sp. TaxID=2109646 RepID=UPI003BAC3AA6
MARAQDSARPNLLLRETIAGLPRGERQEVQVLTATIAPGQSNRLPHPLPSR